MRQEDKEGRVRLDRDIARLERIMWCERERGEVGEKVNMWAMRDLQRW